MNDLIPIDREKQTVNARDLWEFLESRQQFGDWIKNRIEKYEFEENKDFIVFHNSMKNPTGGRPSIEYHISIGMAKELAMIENNDQGKRARRWFISKEQAYNELIKHRKSSDELIAEAINRLTDLAINDSKKISEIDNKVKTLSDDFCIFKHEVREEFQAITKPRKDFNKKAKIRADKASDGECPICQYSIEEVQYDHLDGDRSNNCWNNCGAICSKCNQKLIDRNFRESVRHRIKTYQDKLKKLHNEEKEQKNFKVIPAVRYKTNNSDALDGKQLRIFNQG